MQKTLPKQRCLSSTEPSILLFPKDSATETVGSSLRYVEGLISYSKLDLCWRTENLPR
jgi:hypothetical protein